MNFMILTVWTVFFIYVIFLSLRLDEKISWSWFSVHIPLFVIDCFLVCYLVVILIKKIAQKRSASTYNVRKKQVLELLFQFYLCCMKIIFQVLVCLRLQSFHLPFYSLLIPLWLFLLPLFIRLSISLFSPFDGKKNLIKPV